MASDFERNAAHYDRIAPQYDSHLARPDDLLARAAFRDLVTRHSPPGSTLLDFGCGTGIDALEYARRGFQVLAYDNSGGMVAELKRRCEAEISSGAVQVCSGGYEAFLNHWPGWPRPQTVTANFAVLNSIRDLRPLFAAFAGWLGPQGCVIVSLLNPIHWSKVRAPRWWWNIARADSAPPVHLTEPFTSYFHFTRAVLRAAPEFRLAGRANAGALVRYDAVPVRRGQRSWWGNDDARTGGLVKALWHTPAHKLLGHFVFLVLRRNE